MGPTGRAPPGKECERSAKIPAREGRRRPVPRPAAFTRAGAAALISLPIGENLRPRRASTTSARFLLFGNVISVAASLRRHPILTLDEPGDGAPGPERVQAPHSPPEDDMTGRKIAHIRDKDSV